MARADSTHPVVGQVEALDIEGQVYRSWDLVQARCSIGSSSENSVRIDDGTLAAVHALIVFGKNHSLVRAMGGQVRISGRYVREWLIDEPTLIQCGAIRLIIYPPGFLSANDNLGHRVAAGSVADQAARLRMPLQLEAIASFAEENMPAMAGPIPPLFENANDAAIASPRTCEPVTADAKLNAAQVTTALEPLHRAVQEASDGILALSRRAQETASQIVELPPLSNLSEMTQVLETLDSRVTTIGHYCQSLIANVTGTLDGRLTRLDEVLSRLAESSHPPLSNVSNAPLPMPSPSDFDVDRDPHTDVSSTAGVNFLDYRAQADEPESRDYRRGVASAATSPPESLPAWFEHPASDAKVDADEDLPVEMPENPVASWSTAQLNPIYAEDSNRWLSEAEIDREVAKREVNPDEWLESTGALQPADVDLPTDVGMPSEVEPATEMRDDSESEFQERAAPFSIAATAEDEDFAEEKEESIEDYMTRLLQRVKGTGELDQRPLSQAEFTIKAKETVANPARARAETGSPSQELPFATRAPASSLSPIPSLPAEFVPRQSAPERSENLAALRALANDTARQALQNSSRKKIELSLVGKLAIASLGLIGGIFLLVLNGFHANVTMIGMIASFVVCLLWGYEALVQFKQLQLVKAKEASEIANS